jgi:hypothetical protein
MYFQIYRPTSATAGGVPLGLSPGYTLGAGASSASAMLDLGTDFLKKPRIVAIKTGLASAGETWTLYESADGTTWTACTNTGSQAGDTSPCSSNVSAAVMRISAIPTKRYAYAQYVNGATPQTGLIIDLQVKVREL